MFFFSWNFFGEWYTVSKFLTFWLKIFWSLDQMIYLKIMNKNWSFPLRISSVNVTKSAVPADLVTFIEEILNGKLHFLCSLIAKHEAYGLDSLTLEFIKNYLTNRNQRCKAGNCFSICRKITSRVQQDSILGLLLSISS